MPDKGYIATIGTFDGVHRGHASLLAHLSAEARRLGMRPLALAISPHPMAIVRPQAAPPILTLPDQRIKLIEQISGVEARILSLGRDDFALSGAEFISRLHERCGVEAFVMGFNNHIGSDHATAAHLSAAPIPVFTAEACPGGAHISSSAIRRALAAGQIAEATAMLGHSYTYRGRVAHGKKLGRTISFPTANIAPFDAAQLLPATGVYAVDATLPDGSTHRAMANIGRRPTVDADGAPISFEVHIMGFDGDLYGSSVEISFISRLRDEQHFDSLDALRHQLQADAEAARAATAE
ncbi:MAG: riboflavin biosynthesis protein RibF [Muribaculaceae bacterium]|nr:riboflavin biosynthesis protein RibF [Muribaculaceae bacterium]